MLPFNILFGDLLIYTLSWVCFFFFFGSSGCIVIDGVITASYHWFLPFDSFVLITVMCFCKTRINVIVCRLCCIELFSVG